VGKVNYRILYGFVGKDAALLACGLTKESAVPDKEIEKPCFASSDTRRRQRSIGILSRNEAMAKTSDAIKILKQQTGIDPDTDPEMLRIAEEYRVGQIIHDARIAAQMTQKQLADVVGTTQSVISQLEDAEYEGHSLSMLRRIAEALKMRVHIELIPDRRDPQGVGR